MFLLCDCWQVGGGIEKGQVASTFDFVGTTGVDMISGGVLYAIVVLGRPQVLA